MKYLIRETEVDAFKLTEENFPDIVKELLVNKYVKDISIGNLTNPYLTLTYAGKNGCVDTRTKYFKDHIFIVFEKNEPPKFMEDKDFYIKYKL